MDVMERNKELSSIIGGLARHLEFLEYAGVKDLPVAAWSPELESAPDEPAPREVSDEASSPVEEHPLVEEHGPVAFAIWRLGGEVAFVEGVRAGQAGALFGAAHTVQFERLAVWMSGELGIKKGFSAKNGWTGEYPTPEAGWQAVAGEMRANQPRMVVIFGPVAARALLGSSDVKTLRERFHDLGGISAVATHSPGDIIEDKLLKKETHDDLLMALARLKK